jgi:hypothetical protein
MKKMRCNILGTEYAVIIASSDEVPYLKETDGFFDSSVKKIYVDDMQKYQGEADSKEDVNRYARTVLRHEVIHAFLHESGLGHNSNEVESWATNEEMVDWIAIQYPKIKKVFEALDISE